MQIPGDSRVVWGVSFCFFLPYFWIIRVLARRTLPLLSISSSITNYKGDVHRHSLCQRLAILTASPKSYWNCQGQTFLRIKDFFKVLNPWKYFYCVEWWGNNFQVTTLMGSPDENCRFFHICVSQLLVHNKYPLNLVTENNHHHLLGSCCGGQKCELGLATYSSYSWLRSVMNLQLASRWVGDGLSLTWLIFVPYGVSSTSRLGRALREEGQKASWHGSLELTHGPGYPILLAHHKARACIQVRVKDHSYHLQGY